MERITPKARDTSIRFVVIGVLPSLVASYYRLREANNPVYCARCPTRTSILFNTVIVLIGCTIDSIPSRANHRFWFVHSDNKHRKKSFFLPTDGPSLARPPCCVAPVDTVNRLCCNNLVDLEPQGLREVWRCRRLPFLSPRHWRRHWRNTRKGEHSTPTTRTLGWSWRRHWD